MYRSNLHLAAGLTMFIAAILFVGSWVIGTNQFFLAMNVDGGKWGDLLFSLITQLGEWIPWVVALIVILIKCKHHFLLLLYSCLISTILVQGIKNTYPEILRPSRAIANMALVHTVDGVELHENCSFPSGHTATSFCVFLIACLLLKPRWIVPLGFIYALSVGYSRVYLAQHFPRDIAGGMVIAVVAVYSSMWLSQLKKKKPDAA